MPSGTNNLAMETPTTLVTKELAILFLCTIWPFRQPPQIYEDEFERAETLLEAGADPNVVLVGRLVDVDAEMVGHHLSSDHHSSGFLEEIVMDRRLKDGSDVLIQKYANAYKTLQGYIDAAKGRRHLPMKTLKYPLLVAAEANDRNMVMLLGRYGARFHVSLDRVRDPLCGWRSALWPAINRRDSLILEDLSRLVSPGHPTIDQWMKHCLEQESTLHPHYLNIRFPLQASLCLSQILPQTSIARDTHGFHQLHVAVGDLTIDYCQKIMGAYKDIDTADYFGMSPLLEAVYYGNLEAVKLLLTHGADINHRCDADKIQIKPEWKYQGQISSHWQSCRDSAVQEFGRKNWSALHIAVHRNFPTISKYLFNHGMDVTLRDRDDNTALDLARRNLNDKIESILNSYSQTAADEPNRLSTPASTIAEHPINRPSNQVSESELPILNPNRIDRGANSPHPGLDQVASKDALGSNLCRRCSQALLEYNLLYVPPNEATCCLCRLLDDKRCRRLNGCTELQRTLAYITEPLVSETHLNASCGFGQHPQRHPIKNISDDWHHFMQTWALSEDSSTSSSVALAMASRWLQNCLSNHSYCSQRLTTQFSPTRLLDLRADHTSSVRLVQHESLHSPYVALSHRWGDEDILRTTASNLQKHTEVIEKGSLSRIILDAIRITKDLGYQYLWVDALCIIQDSEQDWLLEASRMSDVFSGAVVTIAAADATNHSQGIFRPRQARCVRPFLIPYMKGIPYRDRIYADGEEEFYVFPSSDLLGSGNRRRGTLDTRGWILQEQLLSPRILYFGNGEIFWDCMELSVSESSPISSSLLFDERPDETWAFKVLRRTLAGSTTTDTLRNRLSDVWIQVVQNYSSRQLSKQSDKLIALEGILKPLTAILQEEPVAGMWRANLWRQLSWWTREPSPGHIVASEDRFLAPSWSWLGVNSSVHYHSTLTADSTGQPEQNTASSAKELEPHMEVLSVQAHTLPRAIGIIGILSVFGPSFRYRLTSNDMKPAIFKRWNASKLKLNPGNWILDDNYKLPLDMHCIVVAEDNVSKMLVCLCLVQDDIEPNKWRRVGLCHWEGLLWQVSKYVGKQLEQRMFEIV